MLNEKWNICYYASVTNFISGLLLCVVSLFTLTALSVDRLLALVLGIRYRQVVTLRRTYLIVAAMWILSIVLALFTLIYYWNPQSHVPSRLLGTVIIVCLFTSFFSYTKIFITLRHNQHQVHSHISEGQPSQAVAFSCALTKTRYRKAVYIALWVQVALVACYLPFFITAIVLASQRGRRVSSSVWLASQFTATLVYLNSSFNPLLYGWKIREVRQAVKETLRQLFRLSS